MEDRPKRCGLGELARTSLFINHPLLPQIDEAPIALTKPKRGGELGEAAKNSLFTNSPVSPAHVPLHSQQHQQHQHSHQRAGTHVSGGARIRGGEVTISATLISPAHRKPRTTPTAPSRGGEAVPPNLVSPANQKTRTTPTAPSRQQRSAGDPGTSPTAKNSTVPHSAASPSTKSKAGEVSSGPSPTAAAPTQTGASATVKQRSPAVPPRIKTGEHSLAVSPQAGVAVPSPSQKGKTGEASLGSSPTATAATRASLSAAVKQRSPAVPPRTRAGERSLAVSPRTTTRGTRRNSSEPASSPKSHPHQHRESLATPLVLSPAAVVGSRGPGRPRVVPNSSSSSSSQQQQSSSIAAASPAARPSVLSKRELGGDNNTMTSAMTSPLKAPPRNTAGQSSSKPRSPGDAQFTAPSLTGEEAVKQQQQRSPGLAQGDGSASIPAEPLSLPTDMGLQGGGGEDGGAEHAGGTVLGSGVSCDGVPSDAGAAPEAGQGGAGHARAKMEHGQLAPKGTACEVLWGRWRTHRR